MTTPSYLNVPQVVDQNLDELFLIVWIGHNLAGLLEVYLGNDWVFSLIWVWIGHNLAGLEKIYVDRSQIIPRVKSKCKQTNSCTTPTRLIPYYQYLAYNQDKLVYRH